MLTPESPTDITRYSPWLRIGLVVLGVALLGTLAQGLAWLLGWDFALWGSTGRGLLLALALAGLRLLVGLERRPAADYGLVVGEGWARELFGGFALGLTVFAAYGAIIALLGAAHSASGSSWTALALGVWAGLAVLPSAFLQPLLFSGLLLTMFRDRYSRPVALALTSLLFALVFCLANPRSLLSGAGLPLFVGLFLTSVFLGAVRLRCGNVLLPGALLGGWLFARRLLQKARPMDTPGDPVLAGWLCPDLDERQAPALWLVLALGTLAVALWRRPVEAVAPPRTTAASFKRVAPFGNMNMLAPLDLWLAQLWRARLAVGWPYVPRLLTIGLLSAVNTLLSLPERLLLPLLLRRRVPDPVFIVGVHRSGTTHLHNLLSLDPRYVSPRTYQVMNPVGFLFSGWLWFPFLAVSFPWRRPMDAVCFNVLTPNEEELALAGVTPLSPQWGDTFPRLWSRYDQYLLAEGFSAAELHAWQEHYLLFLRKLTFWGGRRPLLKNPFNTGRLALLRRLFPHAKFIHIHRNPYAVCRSNLHLAREAYCLVQLQDPDEAVPYLDRFLGNYRAMEEAFYREADQLPADQVAEVRFEALERDPLGVLEQVYRQLGLDFTQQFRQRLSRYVRGLAGYQKNRFTPFPDKVRKRIHGELQPLFARWGYAAEPLSSPGRAA
jgi:hypothetical protein